MLKRVAAFLGLSSSTPVPSASRRTNLGRLLDQPKPDIPGIHEYLKRSTERFGEDLQDWDDYYDLLNGEFFLYWTREFGYNEELNELRRAFERFAKYGSLEFKHYKFAQVKGVLKTAASRQASTSRQNVRNERLRMVRLCVFFLTSGGDAPQQASVQAFDKIAKSAPQWSDDQLDAQLVIHYSSLSEIIEMFERVSDSFEIVSARLRGFPVPENCFAKEQIEAQAEALSGDLRSVLSYYANFIG